MVTIISDESDISTDKVIEWLYYYNIQFNRINFQDYTKLSVSLSNKVIDILINGKPIKIVWIRRGKLSTVPKIELNSYLYKYLRKEEDKILIFLENFISKNKKLIGSSQKELYNNKILNLEIAKKSGFKIPNTIVTNNKKELQKFFNKNKRIITKCIFQPPNFTFKNCNYFSSGTTIVEQNDIDKMNDNFSLSLFQSYIEKSYEVRTFVFNNNFYSTAIFSQNDNLTKIDYRNYNTTKPNRTVPFKLNSKIKSKLKTFMTLFESNTGSIDFIVTPKNKFYFLEINPQGQFDSLSFRCNYYIEKKIAEEIKLLF